MDIYEAIENRRTIKKFESPATEEQLRRIIIAGTKAPSPGNRQSWEFIIVDDSALIEKISSVKYRLNRGKPLGQKVSPEQEGAAKIQKNSFVNSSLVLIYHSMGTAEVQGAWCCIQNMLLAAVAEGLGTKIAFYWGDAVSEINKLMHAPEDMELAAAISIGVPAQEPGPKKFRPEGSWLHRNRF